MQSNYIPWKGYFDIINSVDEFILYDDMQYTKNDWRNRNLIQSANGLQWLTVPVKHSGKSLQKICHTQIANHNWGKKHWQSLLTNYNKAPCFRQYKEIFEELYLHSEEESLSRINFKFIKAINAILKIDTAISWSSDYHLTEGRNQRLVDLCRQSGANEYLSGAAAKSYMDESLFHDAGIKVQWMDYSGYPEYQQRYQPFEHGVTILDLIFNVGEDAPMFMKSFNDGVVLL